MTQYQDLGFQRYIAMFPTWRCNLHCPYCPYRQKPHHDVVDVYTGAAKITMTERPAHDWTQFLAPLEHTLVDVCGGEPTLYPGIARVLESLHPSSRYAMTSNTTQLPTAFKLNPNTCYCWTASYHPTATPPYGDLDFFIGVLHELRRYGFRRVACTIVYLPWKHTDTYVAEVQHRFHEEGIPLNWQPYVWHGYTWTPAQRATAEQLMPTYWPDWDAHRPKRCDAGASAIAINSDGHIYRCLSTLTFGDPCLGDITAGWTPRTEPSPCRSPCVYTCDYWNNNVTYLDDAGTVDT